MNEQIQKSLAGILTFLQEGMQTGADFASEQIPLFIQEILAWGMYEAALSLGLWIILFGVIPLVISSRAKKGNLAKYKHYEDAPKPEQHAVAILSSDQIVWLLTRVIIPYGGLFLLVTKVFNSLMVIGKIIVAPRLYLLEVIQKFIN